MTPMDVRTKKFAAMAVVKNMRLWAIVLSTATAVRVGHKIIVMMAWHVTGQRYVTRPQAFVHRGEQILVKVAAMFLPGNAGLFI